MSGGRPTVLFVCTGNAARSVMAAAMLRAETDAVEVTSAGTHSIPGLPMSTRTRTALAEYGIEDKAHRSDQLEHDMVDAATVIAVFEPMHVSYMRKKHPEAAPKVVSLRRLARDLQPGGSTGLAERVAALDAQDVEFEPWEEVIDPAGGDQAVFHDSAAEIRELIQALVPALAGSASASSAVPGGDVDDHAGA